MTATPTRLLGDICPSWCGGEHTEVRLENGKFAHPDDAGVYHYSSAIDTWFPDNGDGEGVPCTKAATVRIEGYRHDNGEDYADHIEAGNVSPGWMGGVDLTVPDARRLGEALIKACDLAEGKAGS